MSPVDFWESVIIRTFEEKGNLRIRPLKYYKYPIDHPCSIIGDDINRASDDLAAMIGALSNKLGYPSGKLKDFEG